MRLDNAQPFALEFLETRALMSATPTSVTSPNASIPPTQAVTLSGPTNPRRTPLPGTVFNASWDANPNDAGFQDVLWAMPQDFSNRSGALDYSEAKVREIARWARDGGFNWRWRHVEPAKFVVIDVEHIGWSEDYVERVRNVVTWFKEEAPDVAVGLYGFVMGPHRLNRADLAFRLSTKLDLIRENIEFARPVIEKLDAIVVDAYLMGPRFLAQDYAFMRNIAWLLREHYPDMPVVAWTWGNYHTAFGASNQSPLGHNVAKRYLATASGNYDAICVWGQSPGQNTRWNGYLGMLPQWKVHVNYRPATSPNAVTPPSPFSTYRISVRVEVLTN